MSFAEDLPDMDGTDLLGLLFQGEENGAVEPLFPVEDELMESWLSEQDVRLYVSIVLQTCCPISAILKLVHFPEGHAIRT